MGNGSFIDGLPINSMVIFHGYVAAMLNNQMVIQLFQTLASSIWLPVDFIRIGKELRKELCNNQGKQEVLFIYVYIYIYHQRRCLLATWLPTLGAHIHDLFLGAPQFMHGGGKDQTFSARNSKQSVYIGGSCRFLLQPTLWI